MLSKHDENIVFSKFVTDVIERHKDRKAFVVADLTGEWWPPSYDIVYFHYWRERPERQNWQAARSQIGKIIKAFLPRLKEEIGIELGVREIVRKGHPCTEYFFLEGGK